MYRITLVDMPFADLWYPSIALTQLRAVLQERFGDQVRVRILYLNQDIAQYLGVRLYNYISSALETNMAALGDWLFRGVAFPEQEDNVDAYFQRCFPGRDPETLEKKQLVLRKRKGLATCLDRLIAKYELAGEDFVGFTSMFCQNVASFALARRIKDQAPQVITAVGGANCEAPMGPELARNVQQLDYVFSGPALISLPRFIETCLAGHPEATGIRGVFCKRKAQEPCADLDAMGEELDINRHVPLDYDSFLDTLERNFDPGEIAPVLLFETSRGCWWGQKAHCTFCGLNGGTMAYRSMEPAMALAQFDHLMSYAPRCSTFNAVDNILPKNYLTEVLPHLHPPDHVEFFYEVKADLSREDVATLARARVKRIQPGIEALATSTLKLMRKGTSAFQNLTLLKNCLTYGVHPEWNLLIGFPGEGEAVFRKYVAVLPQLVHLPAPTGSFHVRFDRYSPYFVQAEKFGLDLRPSDFYAFIYPFGEEVLKNIAYYFADHNYGADYIATVSEWSARIRERVARWRALWEERPEARPRLEWREGAAGLFVHDSRQGRVVEHDLSPRATSLLRDLQGARALRDVVSLAGAEAEGDLRVLVEKGLVFEEEGRYLSLVTDGAEVETTQLAAARHAADVPAQHVLRVIQ